MGKKRLYTLFTALSLGVLAVAQNYSEKQIFEAAMRDDRAMVDYLHENCTAFSDISKYDALIERGYVFLNLGAALLCEREGNWDDAMVYLINGASNDDLACNRELVKAYGSFHNEFFFPSQRDNMSERRKWNLRASKQGCIDAMVDYANSILATERSKEMIQEAIGYLTQASAYGCYDAKVALVNEYYYGNRIDRDFETALALAEDLNHIKKDDNWVLQQLAFIHDGLGNYSQAYDYICKALVNNADKLSTEAFMMLADYNFSGKAGKIDYDQAYRFYSEYLSRYEKNNIDDKRNLAKAYFQLGYMYMAGEGVKVSGENAYLCFKESAELGSQDGQNSLAMCYYEGIGTDVNPREAVCWFNKASLQGDSYSSQMLMDIYTDSSTNFESIATTAEENASSTLSL
ncbi:MAG: sel1 repeat family protein [Bacteroidaceae bacterium]|nr:sel1 repeat family protein [Bacteroidaceae bacterium]